MLRRLTPEDIAETTGITDAEELSRLQELEILFLSFDEIASLNKCSGLRKLSFIDNGIKKLSNVNVLGGTLVSLCLCDQEITTIENLNLPNLRELFLHRNLINNISGLNYCPRIKKLWLFQNKIASVGEMASTPELEELFLQGNSISSLEGLLGCNSLRILAVAGNPITSLADVLSLENLRSLKSLSFSDIHFGKCPVSDLDGFNHLILSKFRGLNKLNGVDIKGDAVNVATDEMERQLRLYNEEMQSVEDEFRREMQIIENSYSSKESHLHLLEKEMTSAVHELNDVVADGRQTMLKQLRFQESLIDKNFHVLKEKVDSLALETKSMLLHEICDSEQLMYSQALILAALEQLYSCDLSITSLLGNTCKTSLGADAKVGASSNQNQTLASAKEKNSNYCIGFQPMNHNSGDFQMLAKQVTHSVSNINPGLSQDFSIELAKLYRILCVNPSNSGGDISIQGLSSNLKSPSNLLGPDISDTSYTSASWSPILHNDRVFMVLTLKQLQVFLAGGWAALGDGLMPSTPSSTKDNNSYSNSSKDNNNKDNNNKDNNKNNNSNTRDMNSPNPALDVSSSADDYMYDSFEETSPKPSKAPLPNAISSTIANPNPKSNSNSNNSSGSNNNNSNTNNSSSTSSSSSSNSNAGDGKSLLVSTNAPLLLNLYDIKNKEYSVFHQSRLLDGAETLDPAFSSSSSSPQPVVELLGHSKKDKDVLDYILKDADSILADSSSVRGASLSSLLLKRNENPFTQSFSVVLSCIVDLKALNEACDVKTNPWESGAKNNAQNIFPLPRDDDLRNDLLSKLTGHSLPTHSRIRDSNGSNDGSNGGNGSEIIYSLPVRGLQSLATRACLKPEFVCLALVSQTHGGAGSSSSSSSSSSKGQNSILPTIRIMENVLEHISLPNFELEKSSFIMKNFEEHLVQETRYYLDKLLEEVNENEAIVLQQSNDHILAKESALRRLKEDVEKERRLQESLLRDIKYVSANPNANTLPSNHSNSNNSNYNNNSSSTGSHQPTAGPPNIKKR